MRKIFLSVMLLCGSSIGFAQLMEVGSTQKVNLPEGVKVDMATISPTATISSLLTSRSKVFKNWIWQQDS
ncbi:MAG: hypothetical protein L6U61_12890 [Bacteroidales bacterium]|nr:MAG: hypothetical protein L6U61_12890 [Bacteroidales bacterium]